MRHYFVLALLIISLGCTQPKSLHCYSMGPLGLQAVQLLVDSYDLEVRSGQYLVTETAMTYAAVAQAIRRTDHRPFKIIILVNQGNVEGIVVQEVAEYSSV